MFEKEYFDNFYMTNLTLEEYNLDIRDEESAKDKNDFEENYEHIFDPGCMSNNEFLENFMKIDYNIPVLINKKTTSGNENINNDSTSTHSSLNQKQNSSNDNNRISTDSGLETNKINDSERIDYETFMKHKKGRPMTDTNIIYDDINDKVYDPINDPLEYKKARKESAIRSRHKKKENSKVIGTENEHLRMENYRLYHENRNIKKEKNFLIDQIKFMQNLIKSNNLNINIGNKTKSNTDNFDIEKNLNTYSSSTEMKSPTIQYNGARQRPFGKVFSVFLVCILSLAYVSFDATNSEFNTGDKVVFKSGSTISLNDASERRSEIKIGNSFYTNCGNILIVLICGFITWNFTKIVSGCKFYIVDAFKTKRKNL